MVIAIGALGALLLAICTVFVVKMAANLYKSRRVEPAPNVEVHVGPASAESGAESNELEAGELKV